MRNGGGGGGGGGLSEVDYADLVARVQGQLSPPADTDQSSFTADEDAVATPASGWSWVNSGNIASATHNKSSTGHFDMVGVGSGGPYSWWSGTATTPAYLKSIETPIDGGFVFARLKAADMDRNEMALELAVLDPTSNLLLHRVGIMWRTATGYTVRGSTISLHDNVAITQGQAETGVWVGIRIGENVRCCYDLTDSATPPHERGVGNWTEFGVNRAPAWNLNAARVGFILNSYGIADPDHTGTVMHFDDSRLTRWRGADAQSPGWQKAA